MEEGWGKVKGMAPIDINSTQSSGLRDHLMMTKGGGDVSYILHFTSSEVKYKHANSALQRIHKHTLNPKTMLYSYANSTEILQVLLLICCY